MRRALPFGAGLLFAVGLGLSGMTDPRKVIGFLDLFGQWDASLAFVMAGAIAMHLPFLRLVNRPGVVGDCGVAAPSAGLADPGLLLGSALFGVGWGLGGYCPGPAVVSSATGALPVLVFTATMLLGTGLGAAWERRPRAQAA